MQIKIAICELPFTNINDYYVILYFDGGFEGYYKVSKETFKKDFYVKTEDGGVWDDDMIWLRLSSLADDVYYGIDLEDWQDNCEFDLSLKSVEDYFLYEVNANYDDDYEKF